MPAQFLSSLLNQDKTARKEIFETYYGHLAAIAERYSKNASQAQELILAGLGHCLRKLQMEKDAGSLDLDRFMEREFIGECVNYIKSLRSEYYVSSTVYATQPAAAKNYNLFESQEPLDYSNISSEILVKALQQLVPAQRLVFNLHVVDGYSLEDTANLLETSEPTVKSNLEKARYNLQKHIEKSLKQIKS
jgi:RNA polymerase sigma factor (sigma-70 family)